MTRYIAINGKIIPETKASIYPSNPGFLFGEGLFETIRADAGVPFLLPEHLERMRSGLKILGLGLPVDFDLAGTIITDLLAENKLSEKSAVIKLICTRDQPASTDSEQKPANSLIIKTTELDLEEIKRRQSGLRAGIIPWSRNSNNPLLALKSLNYLENRYALQNVKQQGFDEGIFLNQSGELCEGTFSNLFLIRKEVLLTPPLTAGILPGITRAFILEKARPAGIELHETPLSPEDLKTCDGAFLTSSLMYLAPLLEINQIKFDPDQTASLRKTLLNFMI